MLNGLSKQAVRSSQYCTLRVSEQLKEMPLCLKYHIVSSSSHSVNGDIAIQWEWSNFDHSQNPNPLTDYDETLHN